MFIKLVMFASFVFFSFFARNATAAYEIEPWYSTLYYFGDPTWGSGTNMTLIGDYTMRIQNQQLFQGGEFMFVSKAPTPTPPLGQWNWKQGKIGIGRDGALFPGGGGGRIPNTANYDITVHTAKHPTMPNTIKLVPRSGKIPACTITTDRYVYSPGAGHAKGMLSFTDFVSNFSLTSTPSKGIVITRTAITGQNDFLLNVQWGNISPDSVSLVVASGESSECSWKFLITNNIEESSRWGPLFTLRDSSSTFPDATNDKKTGGWYVTPIHANVVASTGHVLISGWLRRDGMPCAGGPFPAGRRRAAVTFLLDALNELKENVEDTVINIQRVEEASEYTFEDGPLGRNITSHREDNLTVDGDSIYCAGHTTLEDGRIFFAGGARYAYMSDPREHEWGLDYARIFHPGKKTFESILKWRMPLGRSWYPTTARLADGRVLVTGAFTDYSTDLCVGVTCYNPQINIFDPKLYDEGRNPWSVLINETYQNHDIDPGIREYTRVFVLPTPVVRDGIPRDVLVLGKAGRVWLLSTSETVPMNKRFYQPNNGRRPIQCKDKHGGSDQSTAVHLNNRGGELLIMGGCTSNDTALQQLNLYNVQTDSWDSYDLHIKRGVPASVFLADGRVLIINGEDKSIDQNYFHQKNASGDPRYAQIFDPDKKSFTFVDTPEDVFRGYHNMAALLRDGSVVLGGGFNQFGDVGCENPNIRRFYPSYLHNSKDRPVFSSLTQDSNEPLQLFAGEKHFHIQFSGPFLHDEKGVALVAVQAFTHSYGQNQRYVKLPITKHLDYGDGVKKGVAFNVPKVPEVLPGHYHLFLLSEKGVPSVAIPAQIIRGTRPLQPLPAIPLTTSGAFSIIFGNWAFHGGTLWSVVAFVFLDLLAN